MTVKLLFWGLLPLLLAIDPPGITGYNYCNNESNKCNTKAMKHFVCDSEEKLKPLHGKAKFVGLVPDTLRLRGILLDYHNRYRNQLASGTLVTKNNDTFPSASQMRELIWDAELAYTARLHASTVSFRHSLCRATSRFPHPGECLGLVFPQRERLSIYSILDWTLKYMFEEYLNAEDPKELVHSFDAEKDYATGHFSVLVNDRVSRVGCAIAVGTHCEEEIQDGYCHFLTCHYDFTNMQNEQVYRVGEPNSKCDTWGARPSGTYENLCSNTGEIYDMNHGLLDEKSGNIL